MFNKIKINQSKHCLPYIFWNDNTTNCYLSVEKIVFFHTLTNSFNKKKSFILIYWYIFCILKTFFFILYKIIQNSKQIFNLQLKLFKVIRKIMKFYISNIIATKNCRQILTMFIKVLHRCTMCITRFNKRLLDIQINSFSLTVHSTKKI